LTVSEEEDSDTFAHPNIKIDGVRKECYRKPMEVNTDFNLQQCSPDVTKLKADHQPNDDCIRLIQSRVDRELSRGREYETTIPYGRQPSRSTPVRLF
jgi:hypothetical protein